MFFKNYTNMLKSMDLDEGQHYKNEDRENIQETLENYKLQSFEAVDDYSRERTELDAED
jgi:hypothetical protein